MTALLRKAIEFIRRIDFRPAWNILVGTETRRSCSWIAVGVLIGAAVASEPRSPRTVIEEREVPSVCVTAITPEIVAAARPIQGELLGVSRPKVDRDAPVEARELVAEGKPAKIARELERAPTGRAVCQPLHQRDTAGYDLDPEDFDDPNEDEADDREEG